jgi:hypothetical protein
MPMPLPLVMHFLGSACKDVMVPVFGNNKEQIIVKLENDAGLGRGHFPQTVGESLDNAEFMKEWLQSTGLVEHEVVPIDEPRRARREDLRERNRQRNVLKQERRGLEKTFYSDRTSF